MSARDLFKKIRDTKGTFHAKMGSIKDRNGMDLTEAVDIKKRWQEYTEELYQKKKKTKKNRWIDNYKTVWRQSPGVVREDFLEDMLFQEGLCLRVTGERTAPAGTTGNSMWLEQLRAGRSTTMGEEPVWVRLENLNFILQCQW